MSESEFNNDNEHEEYIEVEAEEILVACQPIELYKVLKIANLVSGGGEAKMIIADGYVAVNSEIELRKRRKLYDGDVIEFNESFYVVMCDQPIGEAIPALVKPEKIVEPKSGKPSKKSATKNSTKKKSKNKEKEVVKERDGSTGRFTIDF
ncbi:MAG: RNA-binding S4 domain-containing protein [Aliivibrio sp.]|uniref:RNA-binding S4 domain-containing protein n=1 Tax=Aliivibrio sp. TaxID=1872443 RepID=UPI001A416155|nr:RNA-binding S4 domain-containing protein [Aliivibrio sp.]